MYMSEHYITLHCCQPGRRAPDCKLRCKLFDIFFYSDDSLISRLTKI